MNNDDMLVTKMDFINLFLCFVVAPKEALVAKCDTRGGQMSFKPLLIDFSSSKT